MRALPISRLAAALTAAIALAILVTVLAGGTPSRAVITVAAAFLLAAGLAGALPARAHATKEPVVQAPERVTPATQSKEREGTVLAAQVTAGEGGGRLREDLQRVLAGIVADERGMLMPIDGMGIVALFRGRRNHAGAAVHAAQRMLSNVDALSRRLEVEIRIDIGVNSGPLPADAGPDAPTIVSALRIESLARIKRVAVLMDESVVSLAGSEGATLALVDEEPVRLFSFAPVQRNLF